MRDLSTLLVQKNVKQKKDRLYQRKNSQIVLKSNAIFHRRKHENLHVHDFIEILRFSGECIETCLQLFEIIDLILVLRCVSEEASKFLFSLANPEMDTVKLGYNDHGHNEITDTRNK